MDRVRLMQTIGLWMSFGAGKRADYLREKKIFRSVGEGTTYMPRKVPLYPNMIKLGDHVAIASNVNFITHDGIHSIIGKDNEILPESLKDHKWTETIGCIDIGNHVFIAAGCYISYNVKIGDNVIVTANSVVTNDVPSNTVVRGNPAKVVCSLSQFLTMKAARKSYPQEFGHRQALPIGKELEEWLWDDFYKSREK